MALLEATYFLQSYKEFNATKVNSLRSFEKRLHWRCHFIQKLEFEPQLEFRCMHVNFEHVRNQNKLNAQEEEFLNLWKEGRTGFPLIDACILLCFFFHFFLDNFLKIILKLCIPDRPDRPDR